MTAAEIVLSAILESIRNTERLGPTCDKLLERAGCIGRNAQQAAGGREAVLAAVREFAPVSESKPNRYGYIEFWGRYTLAGSKTPGGDAYRVVVF